MSGGPRVKLAAEAYKITYTPYYVGSHQIADGTEYVIGDYSTAIARRSQIFDKAVADGMTVDRAYREASEITPVQLWASELDV